MYILLTQITGILAMTFSALSFQLNKHKSIMIMQIITSVLFGTQYFMLGALTGAALNAAAVVRDIVFYNKDKKWASGNWWTIFFAAVMAVIGVVTWRGAVSLLAIVGMVLNTLSLSCTQPKLVRRIILISSPFQLVYNIVTGSLGGILNEVFVEISTVLAMLRYDRVKSRAER